MKSSVWDSLSDYERDLVNIIVKLGDDATLVRILRMVDEDRETVVNVLEDLVGAGAVEMEEIGGRVYFSEA